MTFESKRILIVEDEYLIAADLKRTLTDLGVEVVGPVGTLRKGLALAQQNRLDAAILDINLAGDASFTIADVLAENDVPFLFLTGYDAWALPDSYADRPTVPKPYQNAAVVEAVRALCHPETVS